MTMLPGPSVESEDVFVECAAQRGDHGHIGNAADVQRDPTGSPHSL